MNQFVKIVCIVAVVLICLGTVMSIAAFALGARVLGDTWPINTVRKDVEYSYENITSLDIDIDIGTLNIQPKSSMEGDYTGIDVSAENINPSLFIIEQNGSELTITQKANFSFINISLFNKQDAVINIYLPEDYFIQDATIVAGAGQVNLSDFHVGTADIHLDAGALYVDTMEADALDLQGGVGESVLKNTTVKKVFVNSDLGKVTFEGDILENGSFSTSVGETDIVLKGKLSDYSFDINTGVGDCTIDGQKFSSLDNNLTGYGGGGKQMDLECDIGAINVRFIDE